MIVKEDILGIVKEVVEDTQFVVDVKISRNNDIIVLIDDYNGITIEECRRISKFIESKLDREAEDFSLEVGSPGLSNPFKVIEQYKKNINKEVEIVFTDGEKLEGKLIDVDNDTIRIERKFIEKINNKKQEVTEIKEVDLKDIKSTKCVITLKK